MRTPDPKPDWRQLHLWQIQPVRDALIIAGVVGLVYLGYMLSVVTVPILVALALAYLFEPVVRWAARRLHMKRPTTAICIIVVAGLAIVVPVTVGVGFGVVQGIKLAQRLVSDVGALNAYMRQPENEEARLRIERRGDAWTKISRYLNEHREIWEQYQARMSPGKSKPAAEPQPGEPDAPAAKPPAEQPTPVPVDDAGTQPDDDPSGTGNGTREPSGVAQIVAWSVAQIEESAQMVAKRALSASGGALAAVIALMGSIGRALFSGFLTAFFFYFFCTGYGRVLKFWEGLIPEQRKHRAFDLIGQMDSVIAGFVRGRLTICAIMIVIYTMGYWLIGAPAPLIIGPLVGLLTIVPYASGALGIPLSMLLMWLQAPEDWRGVWWWILAGPCLVTIVAQLTDDYILTPRVQGEATKLDTPSILFASIAGGVLGGFYGILLAIPAAACIKIVLKELFWPRFRQWSQGKASDFLPLGKPVGEGKPATAPNEPPPPPSTSPATGPNPSI